jgi:sugar-specific transcriptional regulator TrmB
MSRDDTPDEALDESISVLQQLGLKEYEAKCFVGLTRLTIGTAKQLSEVTEVPRTRIYDAIRVLEAQGLVEIRHTSPKQFRAVPLEEALETLRDQYQDRIERLEGLLDGMEDVEPSEETPVQEVWSMTGATAVENRTEQLIDASESEVVFVIGHPSLLTDDLVDTLNRIGPDVDLLVGTVTESLQEQVKSAVPGARTFVSGLEWLNDTTDSGVVIGRLLLVDRSTILVSTVEPDSGDEHAVFGGGFKNGLVVISRRLLSQGLIPTRDPSRADD